MSLNLCSNTASQEAISSLYAQPVVVAATVAFIGVLVTVVVGAFVNFQLAKRRNRFEEELAQRKHQFDESLARQTLQEQRAARMEARRDSVRARAEDLQRATLIELQEGCHALLVATNDFAMKKGKVTKETGEWPEQDDPEDPHYEQSRSWQARTHLLNSRVTNDGLRKKVLSFKVLCSNAAYARDQASATSNRNEALKLFDELCSDFGAQLRALDEV